MALASASAAAGRARPHLSHSPYPSGHRLWALAFPHPPTACSSSSSSSSSARSSPDELHRRPAALPPPHLRSSRASIVSWAGGNGHVADAELTSMALQPRNVLGGPLQCCCTSPRTGYYRDGYCKTDETDRGRHVICAQVTKEFLEFSKSRGNDLMTPAPWSSFPGLKPGDKWCLCAMRWKEALEAKCAPPVFLNCTHAKALEYVTLESLKQHAVQKEDSL